jgi:tetratricopeptide (TPR) repeat protein
MPTKNSLLCDRISIVSISLAILFSFIAFVPGGFIQSGILKGYLIVISVLVGFVSWLLGRLIEGTFHIPKSPIVLSIGISFVVLFISAIFSRSLKTSIFGENFEQGSFIVLGGLMMMSFLVSLLFVSKKRISIFIKGIFLLYILVSLYQIVHLIFPQISSFGVFANRVDGPIGFWSDFAFISGAALIGFTLILQFIKLSKPLKIMAIAGSVLSLFFVILCNIISVWVLVGFSAIVILIYTLITNRFSEARIFPFFAFILSLISLLFILSNNLIGGVLAEIAKTSFIDIHPSFSATLHVAGQSLRAHPLLGAGPNNFINEWLVYRPSSINSSLLWDSPFVSGSSFMFTVGLLGGILGLLSIIFFIFSFAYESVKKVFVSNGDQNKQITVFCLFLITLYFILAITIYSPGLVVVTSTFFFVGLFVALLVGEERIDQYNLPFLKDQRTSFFTILCIVALLMISAGTAYSATERFGSIIFLQKAISADKENNLDKADMYLSRAMSLSDLQSYERTRVLLAEQSIQKTLNTSPDSVSQDAIKSSLQNAISIGNTAAMNAINIDPINPGNYIALGDFLRMILPLKVDGAGDRAKDAYNKAISLAPNYPKPYLLLASLYFDMGDNKNAELYTQKAIALKPNYTDAFFLMSQIQVAEGNADSAISRLQDALLFDSNNPDIYFELGILRFQKNDYTNAIAAFKSAININNQYFNAWYYLALADQKTGNYDEAKTILTALHNRFPDNKNISDSMGLTSTQDTTSKAETKAKTSTKNEKLKKLPVPTDSTNNSSN